MEKAKKAKDGKINLYLNSASDYSIVDDTGRKYTIEEARAVVESDQLNHCNMSLRSLAACEWDIERLKAYYAEG